MRKNLSFLAMLLLFCVTTFGQTRTVVGKVADAGDGSPLAGVTVSAGAIAAQTDEKGNFKIVIPESVKSLSFSSVGYVARQVNIGAQNTLNIQLTTTAASLGEVVVTTAGGILKKKYEVGTAQTTVRGDAVTKAKAVNIAGGLVGKVAGLQIQGTTGGVNPNYRIVLRGSRSLTGNNEALIILDNVIVPNSILSNLNPEDVESYDILQGASAAALYGSQGSNGAIIINTKKGKSGVTNVRVANTTTIESVAYFPKGQTQYGQGGTGYGYDAFGFPSFSQIENQSYGPHFDGSTRPLGEPLEDGTQLTQLYQGNDTREKFWDKGLTNQTDFSLSSGDAISTLYLSGQYAAIKGTTPKDKYNRASFRVNGTRKLYGDKLNASYSVGYTQNNYDITTRTGTIYNDMLNMPSNIDITRYANWETDPAANPNGYYNPWYLNPYWEIDNYRQDIKNEYVVGNIELNFTPIKELNIVARQGITKTNQYTKSWNNSFDYTPYAEEVSGHSKSDIMAGVSDGENYSLNLLTNVFAQAKKKFNRLSTELMVGGTLNQLSYKSVGVSASPLIVPELYNVSNRSNEPGADEASYLARILGAYGSIQLGWDDYLFLHVTGRNDWNSTLPEASRSFFYPSADISFVASRALDFLRDSRVVNSLKLRAGISKVGNVNLGNSTNFGAYQLERTFSQQYGFPYSPGAGVGHGLDNTIVSSSLKPEITKQYEFGFDLDLSPYDITTSFTWYHSVTNNQTVRTGVSSTTGGSAFLTNVGETMSQGLEAALHLTPVKTRDLRITVGGNFTYLDNKVNSISDDLPELALLTYGDGSGIYAVKGEAFPVIKGLDYTRDPEGHVIVDRATGKPTIDQTLKIMGNSVATKRLGLDLSVRFRDFELTGLAEYRGGYNMYFGAGSSVDWAGTGERTVMFNRGRFVFPNSVYEDPNKPGTYIKNTDVTLTDGNGNSGFWTDDINRDVSSNYVSSGAFWKLRELSLAYHLPKNLLEKSKFIKTVTISAQGRNLFIWLPKTNYYTDPEYNEGASTGNGQGITGISSAPPSRYYGGTIALTF